MKRWAGILLFLLIFSFCVPDASAAQKFIALTFDDGPKPHVLYGFDRETKKPWPMPGLLALLDQNGVKATFFVMAWRLASDENLDYLKAAKDIHWRGHEIENHTFGHGSFGKMIRQRGEAWILNDIEKASRIVKSITGRSPRYVRPPEWSIWPALKEKIEARGYRVMARVSDGVNIPLLYADVDSEDYLYYEKDARKHPSCQFVECALRKIEQRERRGVNGHILVFHELQLSVAALKLIIPELKARGYEFVTLENYMNFAKNGSVK